MEIENTNLEPVGGILLNESCLSLPWWLGEGGRKRTQSTNSDVQDSPIFDHLSTVDPLGWNCLVCTLENKLNTSAECITGSETSSLCYFWSLATENVLPECVFSGVLFGCAVGSVAHGDCHGAHWGSIVPQQLFGKKVESQWGKPMIFLCV